MHPSRNLRWLVLLLALFAAGGAVVSGNLGRYPSPYVDDWSDVDLRGGVNDADAAIAACLAASNRAIFREGTYRITPATTSAIDLTSLTYAVVEGAGPGRTILRLDDNDTGAGVLMGDDCVLRNLTIDAFDDASTLGARAASGKHRVRYENVEFSDLATGIQDGGAATNGIVIRNCKFTSCTNGFITNSASTGISITQCVFSGNTTNITLSASPVGGEIRGCLFVDGTTHIANNSGSHFTVEGNRSLAGTTSVSVGTGVRNDYGDNAWATDELIPTDVLNTQNRLRGRYYGNTSPAGGGLTWVPGDIVHNFAVGGSEAVLVWVCTGGPDTFATVYRAPQSNTATKTYDPPSLADGASDTTSITGLSGLTVGMTAAATHAQDLPNGFLLFAQVVSSSQIDVTLANVGGATTDVASGTLTVRWWQ